LNNGAAVKSLLLSDKAVLKKKKNKHRKKILIHMRELRQQPEFREYLERNKDKIAKYNRCVKNARRRSF
jgi:hypothetical protein